MNYKLSLRPQILCEDGRSATPSGKFLWWGFSRLADLPAEIKSACCLFANDTKIVDSPRDNLVQTGLENLYARSFKW